MKPNESAQWLEWLGNSGLPEDVVKDRAYNLAAEWTEKDYQVRRDMPCINDARPAGNRPDSRKIVAR